MRETESRGSAAPVAAISRATPATANRDKALRIHSPLSREPRSAGSLCQDPAMVDPAERERILDRLRQICLGLPETSERLSHGAPTFFVRGKKAFVMVLTNHHGDGRFAIWCAAAPGMQAMLVAADPERFFVPPYVGHRGWLGVRLDRGIDWNEVAGAVEDAYLAVAPKRLVEAGTPERAA